jgi:hypothetical protein
MDVVALDAWTPSASNSLEIALLLQLYSYSDASQDSLQQYVYSVKVVDAVPKAKAARRLLGHQVMPTQHHREFLVASH